MDIIWFNTIDSTNKEALRQLETAEDFTVIAAEYQTAGRGQKGTSWESAPGKNLTFSLILKPDSLRAENQFVISQIVTLGIVSYLKKLSIEAKIKWPNDIYVGDKKICGILMENMIEGANLSASIVGIGLNINQDVFVSDAPNPTSVKLIKGEEFELKDELQKLSSAIYDIYYPYKSFSSGNLADKISSRYHNSLYRLEEFHKFQETPAGEVFEGRIMGISSNACLIIEKRDSSTSEYSFKEIKYIL
ncbi:MAG TPA: biotin--[acetyl-CoA-carboxylase] ligase [Rikenellaceae bacterium]|nr:biotin--[acetyl-CoA-carboxylase] ligase [Rikenellaceae bacterium]